VSRFLAGSFPRLAHSKAHRKIAGAAFCHSPRQTSPAASNLRLSFKTTGPRRSHGLRRMVLRALETALRGLRSLARHCVDPVELDGIALPTCARSIFRSSQSGTRRPRGRKRHRGLSALVGFGVGSGRQELHAQPQTAEARR
jgi:hypothetical protein